MYRKIAALLSTLLLAFVVAAPASAYPTYYRDPPEANSVTAIAGNVFVGYSYADAWDQWFALGSPYGDPVTQISVTIVVGGTVG